MPDFQLPLTCGFGVVNTDENWREAGDPGCFAEGCSWAEMQADAFLVYWILMGIFNPVFASVAF